MPTVLPTQNSSPRGNASISPPVIGVSARIAKPQKDHAGRLSKTANTVDQHLAQWIASMGLLPFLIPSMHHKTSAYQSVNVGIGAVDYARLCDGLILQGGADVSPTYYGQTALRDDWAGDPIDDAYEMGLVEAFLEQGKPIFGICRGMQLLNVMFGGSLYQDVSSQMAHTKPHGTDAREYHTHTVSLIGRTPMHGWFKSCEGHVVSSHHQAVCNLGDGMQVQGLSDDGVIEALHWSGPSFVAGVQWHPEYHNVHTGKEMLCSQALMLPFQDAVFKRQDFARSI
jgi:putative glutamine amidotransferase